MIHSDSTRLDFHCPAESKLLLKHPHSTHRPNATNGQPLNAACHLNGFLRLAAMMEKHNREQLRSELIQLTDKQISIVEKKTFGNVTESELNEYEKRQERIRDLFTELHHLPRAA